jgi:hypothetical protein
MTFVADTGGNYVAAAYVVFLALVLIYVAIMAAKLARIERELSELNELAERRESRDREEVGPNELGLASSLRGTRGEADA